MTNKGVRQNRTRTLTTQGNSRASQGNPWSVITHILVQITNNATLIRDGNIKMSGTDQKEFEATVHREGKFTYVAIPFSPREVWGPKPRYYVLGTINGIFVRGTLGALGQDYFLRLGAGWLRESEIEVGTNVNVKLSLEDRERAK